MRAGRWRRKSTKELMPLNFVAGDDSWESLGQQGDKPVNLKGNQPWIFIGRTDTAAEALVFWSSDANSWLIGKVPDAGKDRRQKRASEDEMAGWLHRCNGRELGRWWGTGKLQSMGLQRVRHDWAAEQQQHWMNMKIIGELCFCHPCLMTGVWIWIQIYLLVLFFCI